MPYRITLFGRIRFFLIEIAANLKIAELIDSP